MARFARKYKTCAKCFIFNKLETRYMNVKQLHKLETFNIKIKIKN